MTFVITEPCRGTCDTSCVDVCPVDCIHGPLPVDDINAARAGGELAKLADLMLYIDPEVCIDCGACEPECPVDAIFEEDDVPDKWISYVDKNAEFFRG